MASVAVPDTIEELLSPAWLTTALAEHFPGVEVASVERGPVVERVSTNARFTITCAGDPPDGLPLALCLKGYFSELGRPFRPVGEAEASFYQDWADRTGMRTARALFAAVDPDTRHGIVILEDLAAKGGRFLDALSPYTVDLTAQSLEQLAHLHGSSWLDPAVGVAPWLSPKLDSYVAFRGIDDIVGNFAGPIGAGVPESVRDPQRLLAAFNSLERDSHSAAPWSIIHGDAHVGNVFLDAANRPGWIDWQLIQRGPWYLDVGYHIASALPPDERERAERDLVSHYLDALASHGVPRPDERAVWAGYRRGLVYGFFLWAITLRVRPEVTAELLRRLGTAAAAFDALDGLA